MLSICNMLLVIFVLFGRNQLYSIDSLPEALHVKVNAPPSIIVLFSGVSIITGVSRSKVESRQDQNILEDFQLALQVLFILLLSSMLER